ncbi:MAG: Hpt domain-containing protein [Roseburia sp.]
MENLFDRLRDWGCDIDGAMARFLNDEELYVECLHTVIDDEAFTKLEEALNNREIDQAFHWAHTLKGVLANMGLTPIYDVVAKIVEILRAGSDENTLTLYREMMADRAKLQDMMNV